jgi:site-specific DNA-methyltransferase (adenine-specific)
MGLSANTVYQGDCLEGFAQVNKGSVALVFADPPFNIGYDYDVYQDRRSREDYLGWSRRWVSAVADVLRPNGTFWLAIGDEFAAELKLIAQDDAGFVCRSWVIWYYTFGVNCARGFSRSHTHLFHFVRDPNDFTFNADNPAVRVMSARQLVYADGRANPKGRLPDNTWFYRPQDIPGGFLPSHDTWYFARVAGTFNERAGFHGCQMPEQLLGRIIRVSSNPGELVLDPFAGSGTTLAVAKKLGRQWLGFELSHDYVERMKQRLGRARAGDPLDGPADPLRSAPETKKGRRRGLVRYGQVLPTSDAETVSQIVSAYLDTHQGKSTDYLLCDPESNAEFVEACRRRGIPGNAFTWNRLLLRTRKSGRLPRGNCRRNPLGTDQMDGCSWASEIAMRLMELDYDLRLDDVLCRPEAARRFDAIARAHAPGFSDFQYRWAALAIRKRAYKAKKLARTRFEGWLEKPLPKPLPLEHCLARRYEVPGVYVVSNWAQPLYVGETVNIRNRVVQLMASAPWQELQPESICVIPADELQYGLQSLLVYRIDPLLNTSLLRPVFACA